MEIESAPDPLLQRARALASERKWTDISEQLGSTPEDRLLGSPELGYLLADASWRIGDTNRSQELAGRLEPITRREGNRRLLHRLINLLGIVAFETGRLDAAQLQFEALLESATAWADAEFAARASNNLGMIASVQGRRDLALLYYERALAAYHRLGYVRGLAQTHHNLGIAYGDLGMAGEADRHYQRAIQLASTGQSEDVIALAESQRALLRARAGDGPLAAALAARALTRFERMGDPGGRGEALRVLAAAARAQEEDRADQLLAHALEIAREHSDPFLGAEVQRDRGLLLRDRGDAPGAKEALLESAAYFGSLGARSEAEAVRLLASNL